MRTSQRLDPVVAPASALFAEVTSAVDGVASQAALSGVTPTPTSTPVSTQTQIPSATVAKRQGISPDDVLFEASHVWGPYSSSQRRRPIVFGCQQRR